MGGASFFEQLILSRPIGRLAQPQNGDNGNTAVMEETVPPAVNDQRKSEAKSIPRGLSSRFLTILAAVALTGCVVGIYGLLSSFKDDNRNSWTSELNSVPVLIAAATSDEFVGSVIDASASKKEASSDFYFLKVWVAAVAYLASHSVKTCFLFLYWTRY